jgi:DegV family protein with EDD domain
MKTAVITDSTCDLTDNELRDLNIRRVPLYIEFEGKTHRDWIDIRPTDIIRGVGLGADLPTTSQPTPKDFEDAYTAAATEGAKAIVCITISSDLSGTFQSATIAANTSPIPVTTIDSRHTSLGLGNMARKAAELSNRGATIEEILAAVENIRSTNHVLFTVASLEFLQKGGRLGRANALVGSLLNIKPILTLDEGTIAPLGKARGNKRALREVINQIKNYQTSHPDPLVVDIVYVEDASAADRIKMALNEAGIEYKGGRVYEMGAVLTSHIGPGSYGVYLHTETE